LPGETRQLRRLERSRAEFGIGDSLIFGAVSAVVRRLRDVSEPAGDGAPTDDGMRVVNEHAERAAQASISVLILGETGVGKEVLARRIHARSARAQRVFLGVNCAAFGEQVLEGELFGYERGAFTGAVEARPGIFEAADGGTVFLDEVGELPASTQVKLLRVLEERTVMRIGARAPRRIDVRFVAATNRELESEVERGRFRRDLYYRLNGISLTIPPLRERPSELEPLVEGFVVAACRQLERRPLGIADDAWRALAAHSWPGNVRELKNAIERAVVLCTEEVIRREHLPSTVCRASLPLPPADASGPAALPPEVPVAELDAARFAAQVSALDRARIRDALERTGGNQTQAAKLLGIARRTLVSRLEVLKLPRPRKRSD
jgi:transcriptional regulator with PAS, ATPase and Fis domain